MADLELQVTADASKALAELNKFAGKIQKDLKSALKSMPDLQINADSSDAEKAFARIKGEMSALADKKIGVDIDANAATAELARLQSELRQIQGSDASLTIRADAASAEQALAHIEEQARQIEGEGIRVPVEAETEPAERKMDGFKGAAMAVGAAAGAAAGALFSRALSTSMDVQNATSKLQAQFGLTETAAGNAGQAVKNIFASGMVSDIGEAEAAVHDTGVAFQNLKTGGVDDITDLSTRALLLAQTFDVDVTEGANAAQRMITSGLAKSGKEAFDVLTVGFQNGANASGDFLETIQEYSPYFAQLGLSGQQAIGMLITAQKEGLRDTDTWADAIKEFGIRAIDASDTTADAFKSLKLDAGKMSEEIAAGGPKAAAAMSTVVIALNSIKDPVERNRIGVELFGTQWEDTARKILPALDPAKAGLLETAGALDKVNDQTTTAAQKVQAMRNQFDLWLASMVSVKGPLGDVAAGLEAFGPTAMAAIGAIGPLLVMLKMNGVVGALRGVAGAEAEVGAAGAAAASESGAGGLLAVLGRLAGVAGLGAAAVAVGKIVEESHGGAAEFDKWTASMTNFDTVSQGALVNFGRGMQQLVTDPGKSIGDIGKQFGEIFDQFGSGTSAAGAAWQSMMRTINGVHIDPVKVDMNTEGAYDKIQAFIGQVQSYAPVVNINGNNNNAIFAYKEILSEIQAGKAEIVIDGKPIPAQQALATVKKEIDASVGQVTINGQTMPASQALGMFLGEAAASRGKVVIDADPATAYSQLLATRSAIDTTMGTVTINGNRMPADQSIGAVIAAINSGSGDVTINGKTVPADAALTNLINTINASGATTTINGNKVPAGDALAALVAQIDASYGVTTINGETTPGYNALNALLAAGNSSVTTARVSADASGAYGVLNALYAQWNGRTIYVNIGGDRITAFGGVFAGGGVIGYAGGGMVPNRVRPSRTHGMIAPGFAPGKDTIPALMSPGEAVLVPELTAAIGASAILKANFEASSGRPGIAVAQVMSHFADGGVVAPTKGSTLTVDQAKAGWFQHTDGSFDNINSSKWSDPALTAWRKATQASAIEQATAAGVVGDVGGLPGGGGAGGGASGPVAVHDDAVKASIDALAGAVTTDPHARANLAALAAILGALRQRSGSGDRCEDSRQRSSWGQW
jgi:phage-related minor tail protein